MSHPSTRTLHFHFLHPLHLPATTTAGTSGTAIAHSLLDEERGEEWMLGCDGVGLYKGSQKVPEYQVLSVQLTTHRLLFLSLPLSSTDQQPQQHLQLHLSLVRQTEHYAGFLRSSPKITLHLGAPAAGRDEPFKPGGTTASGNTAGKSSKSAGLGTGGGGWTWTCSVCGYVNAASASASQPGSAAAPGQGQGQGQGGGGPNPSCKLCGVPFLLSASDTKTTATTGIGDHINRSRTSHQQQHQQRTQQTNETQQTQQTKETACPRCTYLNNPLLRRCEVCGAGLPSAVTATATTIATPSTATATTPTTPPAGAETETETETPAATETIRLSFRRAGDKDMYKRLKTVLLNRPWERGWERAFGGVSTSYPLALANANANANGNGNGNANGKGVGNGVTVRDRSEGTVPVTLTGPNSRTSTPSRGIGIDGILATLDSQQRAQTGAVKTAFEDLEALMIRAGEMVKLVQSLTAKLSTSGPADVNADAEARTFLHSSFVQLGLPVPAITASTRNTDDGAYLDALAEELGGLLTREEGGLMVGKEGKGLLGMDEAWVVWNRARGVSLIPPKIMAKVVPLLPRHTRAPHTVEKLRFLNGLEVLHTPVYSPHVFARRVRRRLDSLVGAGAGTGEPYTTTLDIALTEALSVALTNEMMLFIVQIPDCGLVTDDGAAVGGGAGDGPVGDRWYRDLITDYLWDDPNH